MTKKQTNLHRLFICLASGLCILLWPETPLAYTTTHIKLQGLDKVTGRVFSLISPIKQPIKFGTLQIMPHACHQSPSEELPESKAFLEIWEVPPKGPSTQLFSNWMFASSPALSALDHPVYDVWVVTCIDHFKGKHALDKEQVQREELTQPA